VENIKEARGNEYSQYKSTLYGQSELAATNAPVGRSVTGWAAFFHSASNGVHPSPFLFVDYHCFFFFKVCSWLFFS
jgi:hypothetical protein